MKPNRNRTVMRLLLGVLVLAVAAASLGLAWPRLQASYVYLPVDTALARYFASREIPSRQLEPLVAQTRRSLEILDHYRYWEGLSLLHYLRAVDPATPRWERLPSLRRALRAATESVRRAPANPRAWLMMAQVRAHLREPEAQVLPPLRMSILTGRVEPPLMLARLELGYRYQPGLDAETSALLRDQTLLAWRVDPRGLARAMREGRVDFERVRALLEGRTDVIAEMEAALG